MLVTFDIRAMFGHSAVSAVVDAYYFFPLTKSAPLVKNNKLVAYKQNIVGLP